MGLSLVVTPAVSPQGASPNPLANSSTILDIADIVMSNSIGTGFSHTKRDKPVSEYWSINEGEGSLRQFVRRFPSEYQRWNASRYLLGGSDGTTRSASLGISNTTTLI